MHRDQPPTTPLPYPHSCNDCQMCRERDADGQVDPGPGQDPVRLCQLCIGRYLLIPLGHGDSVTVQPLNPDRRAFPSDWNAHGVFMRHVATGALIEYTTGAGPRKGRVLSVSEASRHGFGVAAGDDGTTERFSVADVVAIVEHPPPDTTLHDQAGPS